MSSHYQMPASPYIHTFEAGKQHKNINEAMKIYEILESNDFARDSTLIAIGGGVIGRPCRLCCKHISQGDEPYPCAHNTDCND